MERNKGRFVRKPLTFRESEALRLLALGRTNPEISREMVFGVSTIEHHVQRNRPKAGRLRSLGGAVRVVELWVVDQER